MIHPTVFSLCRLESAIVVQLLSPNDGVRSVPFFSSVEALAKLSEESPQDHAVLFLDVVAPDDYDQDDVIEFKRDVQTIHVYLLSTIAAMFKEFSLSKAVSSLPEATQEATHE